MRDFWYRRGWRLVWTPFSHGQKGLGSRLAGDTDKRFVYFVSSQNFRPSRFIPMGQNWSIKYNLIACVETVNLPQPLWAQTTQHILQVHYKHTTCDTTVCEFRVSSDEGDSGDGSGGQLPHSHSARRELWHGRHSPWTTGMSSVDTGRLLAHQSDCGWSRLCSYTTIDRLRSVKWVCRDR